MNRDEVEGKSKQVLGKLKEVFSRLTDDDFALYESQRDQFMGKLQEKYGLAKEDAERRLDEIEKMRAA